MLKRYWIVTVALGLIVSFAALWYSWDRFSTYQQNQANERAAAAQYHAGTAQHSPASCRSIMGESGLIDWLTCLANNVSADGSVKQSEYDLKAQQDMAAWALGMLIATMWLTVITLFGVFFVWRTLKATQEMAKDTRNIGQKQTRAYLEFAPKRIKISSFSPDGNLAMEITGELKNSGNSPAIDTKTMFNVFQEEAGETRRDVGNHELGEDEAVADVPAGEISVRTLLIGMRINLARLINRQDRLRFSARILFEDIFEDVRTLEYDGDIACDWREFESSMQSGNMTNLKVFIRTARNKEKRQEN